MGEERRKIKGKGSVGSGGPKTNLGEGVRHFSAATRLILFCHISTQPLGGSDGSGRFERDEVFRSVPTIVFERHCIPGRCGVRRSLGPSTGNLRAAAFGRPIPLSCGIVKYSPVFSLLGFCGPGTSAFSRCHRAYGTGVLRRGPRGDREQDPRDARDEGRGKGQQHEVVTVLAEKRSKRRFAAVHGRPSLA